MEAQIVWLDSPTLAEILDFSETFRCILPLRNYLRIEMPTRSFGDLCRLHSWPLLITIELTQSSIGYDGLNGLQQQNK